MPSLEQDLSNVIGEGGLSHVRAQILARVKRSVRLIPTAGVATVSGSRLGGDFAWLPTSTWPHSQGRALQLLAQINLAELPRTADELPSSGYLAFFYEVEDMPDYRDGDSSGWSVLLAADASTAHRVASAAPALSAASVQFVEELTIPTGRSIDATEMDLSEDDRSRYHDLLDAVAGLTTPQEQRLHRMLGHPDGIQGCMQRGLQFETKGLSLPKGVYSWYEHPRASELIPGAHDWRLLLQVDSDPEQFGTYWGDCGRLYFWIHRDDLAARRFERTWLAFQCH